MVDEPSAPERIEIELTPHAPTRRRARAAIAVERDDRAAPFSGRDDEPADVDATDGIDDPADDRAQRASSWLGTDHGRLVVTAIVTGVVGVLLGWMLGRDGDSEPGRSVADDAPVTTKADPRPSQGPFASAETLPETDLEPPTTRPVRPTTTIAEIVAESIDIDERVVGQQVRLVGLRFDNRLVELDLAGVSMSQRSIPASSGFDPGLIVAGDDWVLLPQNDGSRMRLLRDDGSESELNAGDQWSVVPVPGADELWRTRTQSGFTDGLSYERIDLDGQPLGQPISMPWRSWAVAADPLGGLVTTVNGKVYRVDESGATQLAVGELVGISSNVVVVSECDEELRCGLQVIDRATGDVRAVPVDPTGRLGGDVESLLTWGRHRSSVMSPGDDAVAVVAPRFNGFGLGLVDLETGAFTPMGQNAGYESVVWSPDGRFVFHLDGGRVSALERSTGIVFPVADGMLTWTGLTSRPLGGAVDDVATETPIRPDDSVAEEFVEY